MHCLSGTFGLGWFHCGRMVKDGLSWDLLAGSHLYMIPHPQGNQAHTCGGISVPISREAYSMCKASLSLC